MSATSTLIDTDTTEPSRRRSIGRRTESTQAQTTSAPSRRAKCAAVATTASGWPGTTPTTMWAVVAMADSFDA
ncbi:hypothetical protein [Demequina litorisediminis]|uniref:hypothetical protein n=1 Tax=Demequina litorisediminis TaxID=1849022 RepID=UPI0024E07F9D|nr:hypothetical protein [Demequina litorisediminis]